MKKSYLLLSVLTLTLFLSSCLKEGNRNYAESSVVYIDKDMTSGKIYGKSLTGRLIVANEMLLMQPGTFKFLSYSWDEAYGTTPIAETLMDNVVITGEPKDVTRKAVMLSSPPDVEDPDKFLAVSEPYYVNNDLFLGDNWLFEYAYESRKGETAEVQIYNVSDPELADNEVLLEVRLVMGGEPESGASLTSKTDIIAFNMGPLRAYQESISDSKRDLKIHIQYYKKGMDEPVELPRIYLLTIGDNS